MTEVPDWAIKVPQKITQLPPTNQWVGPTQDQMQQMRKQLLESILSAVVQAIRGIFIPGPFGAALEQLQEWTEDIPGEVVDWVDDNAGINLGSWEGFLDSLNDSKGIDLPVLMAVLQGIQAFFDGIDFTAPDFDPADALQFFAQMMKPLLDLTATLRGLIDISWLTNTHQNLVDAGASGYDNPAVVATDDPNITHDATDGVPGYTPVGCMKMVANGANHERGSDLIEVGRGWELQASTMAKWEAFTATAAANAIRLELQPYKVVGDLATPVGSRVLTGAVASPSGSSGGISGWGTLLSGPYVVPNDGSVTHVALFPRITSAATAGMAKFDNTQLVATQDIPQEFVKDLLGDLQSLLDWLTAWVETGLNALGIPIIGDLFDKINDLADGLGGIQSDADDALAALADKLDLTDWNDFLAQLLSDPGSLLGNLAMNKINGLEDLQTTLNQIGDIFTGAIVTPVNGIVAGISDWFNQWFGGGSDVAIPLSQKGAPYGVAPLGADGRVSYSFLPDDLVPSDGSDINHFILTLPSDFPVPTATETALSGWTQNGSGDEVSFDDGTNTRWSFPSTAPLGWWDVESAVVWEDSSTGARQSGLTRTLSDTSDLLVRTDAAQAASFGLWTPTNNIESIVDVTNTDALHANDKFQMKVWQDSGSTQDVLADGTYIRAVYRGARLPDVGATVAVQYDNRGAGATNNAPGSLSWTHACSGTDRAAIVYVRFSASALTSLSMSATYGGIPMTLASQSPTIIVSSRRYIAFAFILMNPPAGSQTVTVTESHSSVTGPEWSANSVSYTGVSGYTASTTGGSGTSYTDTITSATNRRVSEAIFAFGTAGFNTDYSQTSRFAFTSGGLRTLVAGDAAGAPSVAFTTTAPSSIVFRSIAIDLQAASQ